MTMNRFALVTLLGALSALSAASARAEDQPATDDVSAGRALSLRLCTPCHVVLPDQETAPILDPPAPSFRSIANQRDLTPDKLNRFLAETHSSMRNLRSMPNPQLNADQIRQAVAFLTSLKKRP
jgi:cytochrome c1